MLVLVSVPLLMMQHPGLCQERVWHSLVTPLTVPASEPPHGRNQERAVSMCDCPETPLLFPQDFQSPRMSLRSHTVSKHGQPQEPNSSGNSRGFWGSTLGSYHLGGWLGSWKDWLVNLRAQLERLINV